MNYKLITLIFLVISSSAYAQNDCVFNNKYFTEGKYKKNKDISTFVWIGANKEVKGIAKNGAMFSIKHWSCDHYGTHAIMFIGPYTAINTDNINEYFYELADLALEKKELESIKKSIGKKIISVTSNPGKINLNSEEYSEFYLAYNVSNEVLIIEIKLYKN